MSADAAETFESLGDAFITHDSLSATWTMGAGGAALTLSLDPARDFQIVRLLSPSGRNWIASTQADSALTVNGSTLAFGSRSDGFEYERVTTSNDGHLLRLDASFVLRTASLRVTRHIAVANGTPTFEVWTSFQSLGPRSTVVADIEAFQFIIPVGTVHWLTGHQADVGDDGRDSGFKRRQQDLTAGQTFALGAANRSSEQAVPWLAVDGAQDEFYAGLMWSGAWSLTANHMEKGIALSWGLAPMATTVRGNAVDGPHALFGVARGGLSEGTAALGSYVLKGIRAGRPLMPLVTYNTWFAYGTNVDAASMRLEIANAAALGAELFVIDAGWYRGADTVNPGNFDDGLGSWEADPARFPNGLKPLSDYAHSLGLKFGIWVEPERVNLSIVDNGDVDESWLATSGGSYESDHSAQVCLAGAAGRQWVVDQLARFIDEVQPDYLKWDNNLWVNCDRPGHDHGSTDGSFAHVSALYQILDTLRQRYPNLSIENCSGGGNRMDFGMLRYSDAGWMDDLSAPSVHVRHNIEGLSTIFPPAYLLSFVLDQDTEPLHDAPDLSMYFRSRMGGALGLCFRTEEFSEADVENISHEIAIYKTMRATLSVAAAALLSPQASLTGGPEWDVMQASAPGSDALVLYAYQNDQGGEVNVKPTGLQGDATYQVTSVDTGFLGTATGADIMANGIDIIKSPATSAHILTITAAP
jgi:alpha-galactosidase